MDLAVQNHAQNKKNLHNFLGLTISLIILILVYNIAFAREAGIIDAGSDKSGDLVNLANVLHTLQTIAYKWVSPSIGGGLVIYGFYKIALVRESMAGTIAIVCGGAMFFIQKIIESLIKLGG